jgi:hypothetical protein
MNLPIKLVPVSTPFVDISHLRPLISTEIINQVDAKKITPLEKWSELMDTLEMQGEQFRHIYQSFYFQVPPGTYSDLVSTQLLSFSTYSEGLLICGLVSASFHNWVECIVELTKASEDSVTRVFGNLVYDTLKNLPPFKALKFQQNYSLVKRV